MTRFVHFGWCLAALCATCAAQNQQPPSTNPAWPCVAGRAVDPSYVAVAEGSGGQVFLFDRTEVAGSGVLMIGQQQHPETVFRAYGQLSPGRAREFAFPVDSTIESLLVSVSVQCKQSVSVRLPDGTELNPSGAEDHEYRAGRILKIASPAPGQWKIRIEGRGMFFVMAQARSDIGLDTVRFVERGGRPGHEGMFPVKGPPRLRVEQMVEASVSGELNDVAFRLVSSLGETLESLELEKVSDSGEYMGPVTPESHSFRFAATGRDEKDWPVQRFYPPLFKTAE